MLTEPPAARQLRDLSAQLLQQLADTCTDVGALRCQLLEAMRSAGEELAGFGADPGSFVAEEPALALDAAPVAAE